MFFQTIHCFIAVAECLNFTTAARRLNISQPGLSKIISGIESALNTKLFIRTTRSVRLTEEGERFLAVCYEFLEQCELLSNKSVQSPKPLLSELTIGIGDIEENRYFPQILSQFRSTYPDCNLTVRRYSPEALLEAIDTGAVDFGVLISFTLPDCGYEYKLYYPSPLMVVVPPSHRFANRDIVRISELKDENFLSIYRDSSRAINRIRDICGKGNFQPKIVTETNSLSTVFMLIASGVGISVHFLLHKDSCKHDLRFIPLDLEDGQNACNSDGAVFVWKKANNNPALKPFVDCVDEFICRFQA